MTRTRAARKQLEIAIAWRDDSWLAVEHLPLGSSFSVGTGDDASFALPSEVLGTERLELVRTVGGAPQVAVPQGARLEVIRADGTGFHGIADDEAHWSLSEGDEVTVSHHGFRFRVASVDPEPTPPRLLRLEPLFAILATVISLALFAIVADDSRTRAHAIVVSGQVDLSNPAVRALIEARSSRARSSTTRASSKSAAGVPAPRAWGPVAPAESGAARNPQPETILPVDVAATLSASMPARSSSSGESARRSTRVDVESAAPAPAANAEADRESTTAPSTTIGFAPVLSHPSELGAIRSRVRELDRCFEERRSAASGSPEARARLERCLEEARRAPARPDAIVSFAVEVDDHAGNTERAFGGRFGVAVSP